MAVITRPALAPPLRIGVAGAHHALVLALATGAVIVGSRLLGTTTTIPMGGAAVLVFDRQLEGWQDGDIYTIRADGTDLRQLTSGPDAELAPAWSPDGTRIAYRRWHDGIRLDRRHGRGWRKPDDVGDDGPDHPGLCGRTARMVAGRNGSRLSDQPGLLRRPVRPVHRRNRWLVATGEAPCSWAERTLRGLVSGREADRLCRPGADWRDGPVRGRCGSGWRPGGRAPGASHHGGRHEPALGGNPMVTRWDRDSPLPPGRMPAAPRPAQERWMSSS